MDIETLEQIQQEIHSLYTKNKSLLSHNLFTEQRNNELEKRLEENNKKIDDIKMLITYFEKRFF